MLASLVLPALAALSLVSSVAAQSVNVCNADHYASLSCLTSFLGAASVCSSAPRQTVTLTVTTTTLDINTQTVTAHATTQTTVRETTTEMSTKTITTGPVKTITTMSTILTTESATLTTYIPTAKVAAMVDPLCIPSKAISALGNLPNGVLATACSCIGHHVRTETITSMVTAPAVHTQTTAVEGHAPTTTIYNIVRHTTTVTERPTKFITSTTTECETSTTTVSYAAPTFTNVFGPKVGCSDTAAKPAKAIDASVRSLQKATRQCKDLCAQEPTCSFVYVQRLSTRRAGQPHFECSFGDEHFNIANDLQCGKAKGIYGVAAGYDACDRGTEEL